MVVASERRGVVSGAARTLSRRSGAGGAADIGRAHRGLASALEYSSTWGGILFLLGKDVSCFCTRSVDPFLECQPCNFVIRFRELDLSRP